MAYISETAIEIRAPADQAEKLEAFRASFKAEPKPANPMFPEIYADLDRAILDEAEVTVLEDQDTAVLRFFSPYMKGAESITYALDAIEAEAEEHGWSGTWRRLGEDDGDMDYSYWGDDDRRYDAIHWRRGLEPVWEQGPLVLDEDRIEKIIGRRLSSEDLSKVLNEAMPGIEVAIRKAVSREAVVRVGQDRECTA